MGAVGCWWLGRVAACAQWEGGAHAGGLHARAWAPAAGAPGSRHPDTAPIPACPLSPPHPTLSRPLRPAPQVFGPAFRRNSRWSVNQPVPDLGDDSVPLEKVRPARFVRCARWVGSQHTLCLCAVTAWPGRALLVWYVWRRKGREEEGRTVSPGILPLCASRDPAPLRLAASTPPKCGIRRRLGVQLAAPASRRTAQWSVC